MGGLRLDASTQRLTVNGRTVDLRPKSWDLLSYMAARPGLLLTKRELIEAVWADRVVTEASLNQAVRELRKTLGDDARSPRYIETVHRRGFRFIAGTGEHGSSSGPQATQVTTTGQGKGKLFGREQELAYLQERFKQAADGQRQLCFITGEPGIGKTSLVQAFLDSIPPGEGSKTPLIGLGQCIDQHGEGEAYLPILETIDRLARGPNGERVQRQLQRYAPTWLIQLPWLQPSTGPEYDPQLLAATPTRMLREFCVFCEAIAAESPLVLWLEDLHWSDHSTIDLLHALARRQEASHILVVASYRPVDAALLDAPVRALKQTLIQHNTATELPLELLTLDGVGAYLAARFEGIEQLPKLTRAIHETTDGNPLFMVTLANYLVSKHVLIRDQNLWTAAGALDSIREQSPDSLKGIVELQLKQATDEELSLLETASVLGTLFSSRTIAHILESDLDAVEQAFDQLARHGLVLSQAGSVDWPDNRVSQDYTFIHEVFRRTLYDSISPARLQQLHLCAGEALEEAHGSHADAVAAVLALHFEAGRDHARAIKYLQLAAERARQLGPASEAAQYLERALALIASQPPTTESRKSELDLRLNLMRGAYFTWAGYTPEKKKDNLQRALILCDELQDDACKAPLLSLQIGSQVLAGDMIGAEQTMRQFRSAAENVDNPVLLSHEPMCSGVRDLISGNLHTAEEHFKRSIAMLANADLREPIRLFGHDPVVVSLGYSTISIWLLGFPDEARHRVRLARTRSEAIGAPLTLVNALDMALSVEHFRGDLEAARPLANALDACMESYGVEYTYSRPVAARNWILLSSGDAEAAMGCMKRDIAEVLKSGHGIFHSLMYNTLAQASLAAGAVAEGMEAIEQAMQVAHGGERVLEAESWRLKGELLLLEQDYEKAEQCFRRALTVAGEQSALSLELRAANSLVRLHRDTGRAPEAAEILAQTRERFTEGFDTSDFVEADTILKTIA
ncbi:MAG: AAA family ATPase [Halieaceae bacterium]